MRVLTRCRRPGPLALLLLAGVLGCANNNPPATPGDGTALNVALKHVHFADYQDTLKQLQGKVVLVDFWQDS